jgi:hypothetical protein
MFKHFGVCPFFFFAASERSGRKHGVYRMRRKKSD